MKRIEMSEIGCEIPIASANFQFNFRLMVHYTLTDIARYVGQLIINFGCCCEMSCFYAVAKLRPKTDINVLRHALDWVTEPGHI